MDILFAASQTNIEIEGDCWENKITNSPNFNESVHEVTLVQQISFQFPFKKRGFQFFEYSLKHDPKCYNIWDKHKKKVFFDQEANHRIVQKKMNSEREKERGR